MYSLATILPFLITLFGTFLIQLLKCSSILALLIVFLRRFMIFAIQVLLVLDRV